MASDVLMNVSKDERERAILRSRRMYQTDMLSDFATVRDEGLQEGLQKGRQEEKLTIARELKSDGYPIDT